MFNVGWDNNIKIIPINFSFFLLILSPSPLLLKEKEKVPSSGIRFLKKIIN